MVGLPSQESRGSILMKLLSKEKVEGLYYKELAAITDGYTGSDLKNLCITAAYRPVKELIQKERKNKGIGKSVHLQNLCSGFDLTDLTRYLDKHKFSSHPL
ncbi:unnamed protein product [Musa acuminata subsp. malaccensis]|uniref:(wild Malaysian banana) hypothetical protein n=1 Tax=Musa acuminata subsp. malaccensis TaxID=214687 RepID=A0A804JNA6_MUSAM|nr:unnamed protein product [Musa acuminata subsp. malaccensis]